MKQVTRFRSEDGCEFILESTCLEHEVLCNKVKLAMLPLGDCPAAVEDGKGWLHHDPAIVIHCRKAIMQLCCIQGMAKLHPVFENEDAHPMSVVGRILDDVGGPISKAWTRFQRIDDQGREHQQPYYAINGPDKKHVCVEDRRA